MANLGEHPHVPAWASTRRVWIAAGALFACLAALTLTDLWLESHTGLPVGLPMSPDATKPDLLFGYGQRTSTPSSRPTAREAAPPTPSGSSRARDPDPYVGVGVRHRAGSRDRRDRRCRRRSCRAPSGRGRRC